MMTLPRNPIFIVGYPRSGTTILQRILATQPGLYTFPETHYFSVIEKIISREKVPPDHIPPGVLEAMLKKIAEKMELRFADAEHHDLRRLSESNQLTSKYLFEAIVTHALISRYPDITSQSSFRWIEKTPNHAHFLERIISLYPHAQILHVLRHPVPAVYSRKMKFPFNRETPVMELARRWNRMLGDVDKFRTKHADSILTVRYENLIDDTEENLRTMAVFLRIPFNFKALDLIKQKKEHHGEGFILPSEPWKQADLNLGFRSTNDDYRDVLCANAVRAVEEITMERMAQYGYASFNGG